MPFGIPSEDFHGGFSLLEVKAGGEIREARELLTRSLEMLYLLGYDSGFTNSEISTLTTDIKKFLEETE